MWPTVGNFEQNINKLTGVQLAVGALYGSVLGGPAGASASSCMNGQKTINTVNLVGHFK